MCGIIGAIGNKNIVPTLIESLKRLEYRGYDSAGIAAVVNHDIQRRRTVGKISELANSLASSPIESNVGIGHTRWATHGKPSVANAHPHASDTVALVHNGIIENHSSLRHDLEKKGYVFSSETDTETVVHLITDELKKGKTPLSAVKDALKQLEGSFAFGIIFKDSPDTLIGAKKGSPLAIGKKDGCVFLGSDAIALSAETNDVIYLEDGDVVELNENSITIYDKNDKIVERELHKNVISGDSVGKDPYAHFMLKEIYEQPIAISKTFASLMTSNRNIDAAKI
ncbi:MAG: class II glutamine amidotransferase, partial [Alphaproteobacteria bacterium]|nr:class II glutamine amidotransferase [Alphaproteobacteria bacterium]